MFREEFERRRIQLCELCRAVRVDTVAELQELLCAMVLAECVYKVPNLPHPSVSVIPFPFRWVDGAGARLFWLVDTNVVSGKRDLVFFVSLKVFVQ
jgi:hypothetical protein